MELREEFEQAERRNLSSGAAFSDASCGRERKEPPDGLRTCYMRDRDRILHCKAFRRLKHKTQVFLSPEGDHYRTRLTHTLEVSQISRTVARALRLNEDLTEAVALGHDLGHTPFGHAGERALTEASGRPFEHNEQSVRVVRVLENEGKGLNLTFETMDGIRCHTGDKPADTKEGQIVHWADRIAYISHDLDDAVRAGVLTEASVPSSLQTRLGGSHSARINTLVLAMVHFGLEIGMIGMYPGDADAMEELRQFLFERVYKNPVAKGEEGRGIDILKALYAYFIGHVEELPPEYRFIAGTDGDSVAVCDYIAGMTDRFAVAKFEELFIPKFWSKI